jgi:PAS domain S-box-containing protein
MNPAAEVIRSHTADIAARVAQSHDAENHITLLQQLIERVAAGIETNTPLDPEWLGQTGLEDPVIAKILRSILFETIEVLRAKCDSSEFGGAVLALRACIQRPIGHPPIHPEDRAFHRTLLSCDCDGLNPDHQRLMYLFEDIMLTFPAIVYVHDLNGTILYLNRPVLKLTKFTVCDLREGLSVSDLIAPEYTDLIEERLDSPGAVSRGPYATEIYTKDGERIPFELTTRCIKQEGRVVGVVRDHGGRIDLESKEGAGATFTIALPIPDAKE